MDKIDSIKLESVSVTFSAGTNITKAIREAIVYSVQEGCEVRWFHNETPMVVDARPLVEEVYLRFMEGKDK